MAEWLLSDPKRAKKNYRRFITGWLSRAQERIDSRPKRLGDDLPPAVSVDDYFNAIERGEEPPC